MLCSEIMFGWNWPIGSWEKDFVNFVNAFLLFRNYLLKNLRGPSFEQSWFTFTQGCFVSSMVEIGPVVLEKKMKMWKVYRQTDDRRSLKLTWAFSSGDLKRNIRHRYLDFASLSNVYSNTDPVFFFFLPMTEENRSSVNFRSFN